MKQTKELHLASSINVLEQIVIGPSNKALLSKKPNTLLGVAKKLYVKCQSDPFDEEMTYILVRRFLLVYDSLVNRHSDANYIQIMLGKEAAQAKLQQNELRDALIKRYEAAKNQAALRNSQTVIKAVDEKSNNLVFNNRLFISCQDLFRALFNSSVKILVLDTRSEEDFGNSHIKCENCINIPEDKIQAGLSAHKLGTLLPIQSLKLWEKRDAFEAIVLVDWNTTTSNFIASKLHKLRVTISEWDVGRTYKEKPVVLNYGFVEWLEMYPMFCTKSNILYSRANQDLDDLLDLENIEYPTDAEPKITPILISNEIKESPKVDVIESRNDILEKEEVIVKKINDVAAEILNAEKEWKDLHEKINTEDDNMKLNSLIDKEKRAEEKITSLSKEEFELLRIKNNLTDNFDLAASFQPGTSDVEDIKLSNINKLQRDHLDLTEARKAFAKERQNLLDAARQAKKPTLTKKASKPEINRLTKPKQAKPVQPPPNRVDGKVGRVADGLTGLYNIRNTCYMNTIVQCLRHVPQVFHYYCDGIYSNEIYRVPPILTNEIAHIIRAIWTNTHMIIRPNRLYQKMVALKRTYGDGNHEDCMEFFLTVLNYLSEDCSTDFSSKQYWSDSQMSWYKQHNGKTSFYINNFYHQMKVETHCPTCQPVPTVKYEIENVIYLHLPNADTFDLAECVNNYINSSERIPCKKCNKSKIIKKSMNFFPNVLVISLKRHLQDYSTGQLQCIKNSSNCNFSFHGFYLGNIKYNLKAIALHSGSVDTGHYTAGCLNPINNEWFYFNDESVTRLNKDNPNIKYRVYGLFYSIDNESVPDMMSDRILDD